MKLNRIEPLSLAKLMALVYALFGLIVGAVISLVSLAKIEMPAAYGVPGPMFGPAAIIMMPIYNAVMGFIGGFLTAVLYNLVAGWIGGVEITFDEKKK